MLTKKQQRNYFEKRIKHIQFYLHAFCISKDMEDLHNLRVEIKKVTALVHLSSFCSEQKKMTEQFKPLKELFKHAGFIRNVHISLQLTKGIANKKFIDQQNLLQETEWKKLFDKHNTYNKQIKSLSKHILPLFKRIKNKQSTKWYRKELNKADTNLMRDPIDPHAARKKIKRMLYMDKLHHSKMAINRPFLVQLEDDISNWHDIASTIKSLDTEPIEHKSASEKLKAKQNKLYQPIRHAAKYLNNHLSQN